MCVSLWLIAENPRVKLEFIAKIMSLFRENRRSAYFDQNENIRGGGCLDPQ